jgi:hypothetical protein
MELLLLVLLGDSSTCHSLTWVRWAVMTTAAALSAGGGSRARFFSGPSTLLQLPQPQLLLLVVLEVAGAAL